MATSRWIDKFCCTAPPYTTKEIGRSGLALGDYGRDRASFRRNSAARVFYNPDMEELLDGYHTLSRLGRACISDCHSGYASFMEALSDAIYIVDESDMKRLLDAWKFVEESGKPSKSVVRRHCKTFIPQPAELILRTEGVIKSFLQKTHMSRGCLSDPKGEVLYRIVKYEQLRGNKSVKAKLPVYQGVRSSSQLEGFHFHQNLFVTGKAVRGEFWQAQMSFEVANWNKKRAVEHLHHTYPKDMNPKLLFQLNRYHEIEHGKPKYPDVVMNFDSTNETFGYEYLTGT